MSFVADVHLHSHYSRATSRDLNPENLHKWAALKGIDLVGTADFTHPEWLAEIKDKLEPAEDGVFRLKPALARPLEVEIHPSRRRAPRFLLTVEISSIYKKNGRTRKVHNVVALPGFAAVDELNRRLGAIGNLKSDGRPILGLDSRDLLEICLEVCADVLFIPAHIWTPHFAVLGSSSGFDSIAECFDDLLPHIYAVETGLSSDPPMNSRLTALDRYTLVSNSDAHSPGKLGREATCFDTELSYPAILAALRQRDTGRFTKTIEFYPEEGKYHYDGHRKCGVCWEPEKTIAAAGLCPECGRKLVVGVLHRVEALADRPADEAARTPPRCFEYLIPLPEVIGSAIGVGANSKRVHNIYQALLGTLGPELHILRDVEPEQIERCGEPLVAEGVRRMRDGRVRIDPGYDGEFGRVRVFSDEDRKKLAGQARLFSMPEAAAADARAAAVVTDLARDPDRAGETDGLMTAAAAVIQTPLAPRGDGLDPYQRRAVEAAGGPVVVLAGPGAGKTRTLIHRIAHLIDTGRAEAGQITALTFTNRAAAEVRQRVDSRSPERPGDTQQSIRSTRLTVGTFHAVALEVMRHWEDAEKIVLDAQEARHLIELAMAEAGSPQGRAARVQELISRAKAAGLRPEDVDGPGALGAVYAAYQGLLDCYEGRDFDDILLDLLRRLEERPDLLHGVRERIQHLLVDEFQDVNEVQYRLVKLIAGSGEGLFVIGDPDQAIYGFRGADAAYFDHLRADFPAAKVFRLQHNYRSHPVIVEAAAGIVHPRGDSPSAPVADAAGETASAEPPRVRLIPCSSEIGEGIAVVQEISRMVGGADMVQADRGPQSGAATHLGFADFAVLMRTGRQAEILEECFVQEGLPYRLVGQRGFLAAPSVLEALAFFRYVDGGASGLRLVEASTLARFDPGKAALSVIAPMAAAGEVPDVIAQALPVKAAARLRSLQDERHHCIDLCAVGETPASILHDWQQRYGDPADAAFQRLIAVAEGTKTMRELLQRLVLGQDADIECAGRHVTGEAVTLMTMHAAKGLEFPVVFVCGVEDGLVPLAPEGGDRRVDVAEESRLLYVAMTRARDELVLFHARNRVRHGRRLQPDPSPFLGRIPARLLHRQEAAGSRRESRQLTLF